MPGGWLAENCFQGPLPFLYDRQCENPLELVCRKNLENFGEESYRELEWREHSLLSGSSQGLKDQKTDRNVGSKSVSFIKQKWEFSSKSDRGHT